MAERKYFVSGVPFKFSRTKVELFIECPRCFYLDRVRGISRPPGFPFSLNNAVDSLFKKEFDLHRLAQTPHKLLVDNHLDLVPFQHTQMEDWRNNFKGVQAMYKGYQFYGAVDDVWVDRAGVLYVVDYKATAKEEPITELSTASYHDTYRRQMEFYQWLLAKNNFQASPIGYFVYTTGDNTQPIFNGQLKFRTHLIPYTGNYDWVEPTLDHLITTASNENIPAASNNCEYCKYVNNVKNIL